MQHSTVQAKSVHHMQQFLYQLFKPDTAGLSGIRVLRRIIFALIFFLIIDLAIKYTVSNSLDKTFDDHYRFKEGTDISPLAIYVDHIKTFKQAAPDTRVIAFLGSSPSYGHRIKKSENTYPYAFESHIEKHNEYSEHSGNSLKTNGVKVFNLASNGQLVADQYYIAKALVNNADAFVIQLNYHTFNPGDKQRPVIRYADLPQRLGVQPSRQDAALLSVHIGLQTTVNQTLSRIARRGSFTFANREYIANTVFGGLPEEVFFKRARNAVGILSGNDDRSDTDKSDLFGESDKPFASLTPVQKMLIIKRCSTLYDFTISQGSSEVYFLKELVNLLAENKKPAVFVMTPINVEALDEYGIIDWDKYDKNSATLKSIVEKNGLRYIDANAGEGVVPSEQFFDISHTLDSGGQTFGAWLAGKSKGYLWGGQIIK